LALNMPIVSGNVSLYNETDGTGIHPTPTIGAVGLLMSLNEVIRMVPKAGDKLVLLGETHGHLGQSALLADVFGKEIGDAPKVDLSAELLAGELVRSLHKAGLITAAHDVSDGGIALAVAEMCLAGKTGAEVANESALPAIQFLFAEDQARYVLSVPETKLEALLEAAQSAGVPAQSLGQFGGDFVALADAFIPLTAVKDAFETGLPDLVA